MNNEGLEKFEKEKPFWGSFGNFDFLMSFVMKFDRFFKGNNKIKNGMHLGSYQKFRLFRDPKRFLDIYFSKLQQNISTYKPKTVLRLISDFTVRFRYESRFFSFEVFNRMLMAN